MAIDPTQLAKVLGMGSNLSQQERSRLQFREFAQRTGRPSNIELNDAIVQRRLGRNLLRAQTDSTLAQAQQRRGIGAFQQAQADNLAEALGLKERTTQAELGLRGQELVQGFQQNRETARNNLISNAFDIATSIRGEKDIKKLKKINPELGGFVEALWATGVRPEPNDEDNLFSAAGVNTGVGLRPGQERPTNREANNNVAGDGLIGSFMNFIRGLGSSGGGASGASFNNLVNNNQKLSEKDRKTLEKLEELANNQ